jgi:hypothetical protein
MRKAGAAIDGNAVMKEKQNGNPKLGGFELPPR